MRKNWPNDSLNSSRRITSGRDLGPALIIQITAQYSLANLVELNCKGLIVSEIVEALI